METKNSTNDERKKAELGSLADSARDILSSRQNKTTIKKQTSNKQVNNSNYANTKKQIALNILKDKGLSAIVHRADGLVKGEIEIRPRGGYFDSWEDIIDKVSQL